MRSGAIKHASVVGLASLAGALWIAVVAIMLSIPAGMIASAIISAAQNIHIEIRR